MRGFLVLSLILSLFVSGAASAAERAPAAHHGRPKVVLETLDLSKAPGALAEEKYLREVLARETRHADWGTGAGSRIEYRFRLEALDVTVEKGVLRVSCSGSGWLPRSPRAKSRLTFGGAPGDQAELVRHVLTIVARGVVTRLADMERQRRSAR